MDTSHVNLVNLIGHDTPLKKVASTRGGEYHGPCPFCGGKDRFSVQPNRTSAGGRWSCRQCSPHWQDAIEYIKRRDNVAFAEACGRLNLTVQKNRRRRPRPQPQPKPQHPVVSSTNEAVALVDDQWQASAEYFCKRARFHLWKDNDQPALNYLKDRGLSPDVIRAAGLGYNPKERYEQWSALLKKDVWLPEGITIPWVIGGRYWAVKIRRPPSQLKQADLKYCQPNGGANGLYRADEIHYGDAVVMVEGEFDALAILANTSERFRQEHRLVPVATGPSTGARTRKWLYRLAIADRVLLAFDADNAGHEAARWWREHLGEKATRLAPTRHDITDMVKEGELLESWLLGGIE